ncbi:hypothetical protein D3C78_1438910 [compost metagenome]
MNKLLIDYIRDESQCNYADIYDYFKDFEHCSDELRVRYLVNLLLFISQQELEEEIN